MGLNGFQGSAVDALNKQDSRTDDLLKQVVDAAAAVSDNNTQNDVNWASAAQQAKTTAQVNADGGIKYGGKVASLQGTGGVALLEYAKDAIQTAVSNISGVATVQKTARTAVERKMTQA